MMDQYINDLIRISVYFVFRVEVGEASALRVGEAPPGLRATLRRPLLASHICLHLNHPIQPTNMALEPSPFRTNPCSWQR
jgi:hypothetical protein